MLKSLFYDYFHQHKLHHHKHHHIDHHHVDHHIPHNDDGNQRTKRIFFAFMLNLLFALVELLGAFYSNSLALMSDAIHDLGDSLSLGVGFLFEKISHQEANSLHTYGFRRFSILSALINGIVIVTSSIILIVHSTIRLFFPEPINTSVVIILAFLGIIINGLSFLKLAKGHSLNETMLKYHMLEDLGGWVIVLLGSLIIKQTQWYWLDPLLAWGIALWIIVPVSIHLKKTFNIFMQMWPDSLPRNLLLQDILNIKGVKDAHHLNGWSLDGEKHIVTMHLVIDPNLSLSQCAEIKNILKHQLRNKWNIVELTIELEVEGEPCLKSKKVC